MKLIDAYLWRYGKKRYDVYKETGLSQQTLASANGKRANTLTVRIVQAIARTVGRTSGEVLDELIAMEEMNEMRTATTKEQLWELLRQQEDKILVRGELCIEVYDLAKKMYRPGYSGLQAGTVMMNEFLLPLMEKAIRQLLRMPRKQTAEEIQDDKIADRLRKYRLYLENGDVVLVLAQLEQ